MKFVASVFSVLFILVTLQVTAQKKKSRLQPGKMYEAGQTLFAPRFGFIAKVPEGWEGILPRESEVFLLTTTTSTYGEIFVFGREHSNLNTLRNSWLKGVELSESIRLKAIAPNEKDGMLSTEIKTDGDATNQGKRGFVIARCSPSGPCVITLVIAPTQFYESVKTTAIDFMKNSSFEAPSNVNPYEDFDWQDFLSDKLIATILSEEGGSKETMIHLCKDGSFTATVKKKGFFKKQNPQYKGTLSGQWSAKGDGEKAIVQFVFTNKGVPPLEIPMIIKEEKIIINGDRYFVANSDKCK